MAAVSSNGGCQSCNRINDHDRFNQLGNKLNNFNHSKEKKICFEEKENTNCNNLSNFCLNKDQGINRNCGNS